MLARKTTRLDGAYFEHEATANPRFRLRKRFNFGVRTFVVDTSVQTVEAVDHQGRLHVRRASEGPCGGSITGGLYVANTSLTLSQATLGQAESEDVTAPLPVFGLRGDYAFNDHITLRGAAQWSGYDSTDVEGRLTDVYVGADYGFGKRIGRRSRVSKVAMNLGAVEDNGFDSRLDWGYDGFMLYFKVDLGERKQ